MAAMWFTGNVTNGLPDVRCVQANTGDIFDYEFNGVSYVNTSTTTQPNSGIHDPTCCEVVTTSDSRYIFIQGTFGDAFLNNAVAHYNNAGEYLEALHVGGEVRPIATGNRLMNFIY